MQYMDSNTIISRFPQITSSFLSVGLAALLALLTVNTATADISIVTQDGANEGFNDPTAAEPVGGNSGESLGQQRINVFNEAARLITLQLNISQPIRVEANFDPLYCSTNAAMLGSAGPAAWTTDESTMRAVPDALQNQLSGGDVYSPDGEILATFNSAIDNNSGCLSDSNWYYGFDEPPGNDLSLLSTVMHELIHGLGFVSLLQSSGNSGYWIRYEGQPTQYFYDPFTENLMDGETGILLPNTNSARRRIALRSETQLIWVGEHANEAAAEHTDGVSSGQLQMYAPATYDAGSSVSHFNTSVTPNELMEPFDTGFETSSELSFAALLDIGWDRPQSPPELASIGDQTINEDQRLETEISATDINEDTLTFSVTSDEPKLNVSLRETSTRVYLVVNPEENFYGEGSVTVTVSDGTSTDEETLTVTVNSVNDLPVITVDEINLRTQEEQSLTFTVNATDIDHTTLIYTVRSLSEDISASVSGNSITLSPSQDKWGNYPFSVSVSDGVGSVSQGMMLYVENVNDLPYVSAEGGTTAEDTTWSTTFSYGDVDGRAVTLNASADVADTQLSISGDGSTGSLEVSPPTDFYGDIQVTVAVTENSFDVFGTGSSPATVTDTFILTVSPVNDAPTLAEISNQSMRASDTLSINLDGEDVDNDALSYSISSNPQSFNARISQGQLILELDGTYIGTASLGITVSDGSLTATQSFLIEVGVDNVAPVLGSIESLTTEEDSTLSFTVGAEDEDADPLIFSVSGLPDWVSAEVLPLPSEDGTSQANIQIVPAEDAFGEFSFTVTVSDGVLADWQVVSAHITAVNDAPEFSSEFPASVTMEEDSTRQLTMLAVDAESDAYFFSVENAPETVTARVSGSVLILEPERDFNGEVTVTLEVYGNGGSNFHTLTINVTPVNDRPLIGSISNLNMSFDSTTELAIPLTDTEGDAVVSVSSQYPELVQAEIIDGVLQLSSPKGYNGPVLITLTIFDGEFESIRPFVVTITGGKPRPEIIAYVDGEEAHNGDVIPLSTQYQAEPFHLNIYSKVGEWQYSVWYNNEERLDLIEIDARGDLTIAVPATGAFAGEYEILATDVDEVVPPLTVQFSRPPAYSLNADPLLIGSDQGRLKVRGLVAGQTINATTYSNNLQIFHPQEGQELPAVVLDDPENQNETGIGLLYPVGTDDNTRAFFDLSMADFPIKSNVITGKEGIHHTVQVVDDNAQSIAGVVLTLTSDNLDGWGMSDTQLTDDAGEATLTLPPTELRLQASKDGYHPETLDIVISESMIETRVTLLPRPGFYTLRVKLLANEFDFSAALPTVFVEFANGETEQVSLTSVSTTTAYAEWQWDWSGSVPSGLLIIHEDATEYTAQLDTRQNSESKEAYLWAKPSHNLPEPEDGSGDNESPNSTEETASESDGSGGSSGGGNAAWLLVTALALLGRRRTKRVNQAR
ncbi:hypothetical protein NBRC116585_00360 [Thalassolituus maritimus]|uniref:Cadherin domain-containing protein n=2 Tax=Thalassolituus maritimus TaxID=484498 RepID=A0ABP9ZUV2_9GAMM